MIFCEIANNICINFIPDLAVDQCSKYTQYTEDVQGSNCVFLSSAVHSFQGNSVLQLADS